MKRIIYISLTVFALGMMASCAKQDIQPNSSSDVVVPEWKSNSDITDPELGGTGGDGITDPNNDPELETSGT